MRRENFIVLSLLVSAVSCAYGPRASPGEDAAARDDAREISLEEALHQLAFSPSPACEKQCSLVAEICALSDRVCKLSERDPADLRIQDLCRSGQRRCQRVRRIPTSPCSCGR
jgi:hypothetical protein